MHGAKGEYTLKTDVLLSVIIPAYNAGSYIDDCLRSVMTQEAASFEVVLVNDGSTDRTTEICRKWTDVCPNILYIEQRNQGQGAARNTAIRHAHGQWLVFLDADDVLRPGALEYLEKNAADAYDVICYGSAFIARDQEEVSYHFPPCAEEKNEILQETLSVLWDKMFRRDLWLKEGIELSDQYGEDIYPVYMMLAKAGRILTLQRPLISHYDRVDNLSSRPDRIPQIVQSVSDTLENFQARNMFEEYEIPLFLMLEKQHRHYKDLWNANGGEKEKEIVERLQALALQYFPGEYQNVFHAEDSSLIFVGRMSRSFPGIFENWNFIYYDCLEQYLTDENKPVDTMCHFIINVENETNSVRRQIRTAKWALSHWRMLCGELTQAREKNNLRGKIFLYVSKKQEDELTVQFEKTAQISWDSIRLDDLIDFWRMTCMPDCENETSRKAACKGHNDFGEIPSMNYRWEYMRLDYNVNLLCPWLWLKQQGRSLEAYFSEHGYKSAAIYGMGYMGKLLIEELRYSSVEISFLIDCDRDQRSVYPVYSPEDKLPETDVIVVSVVHVYWPVRGQLQSRCACPVVSLQDLVDWCQSSIG